MADTFCNKICSYYNWENTLKIDFSELPIFADTENTIIATQTSQFTLAKMLLDNGAIDENEFKKMLKDYGIIN